MSTQRMLTSEYAAVVGAIDPASAGPGEVNTGWIDASDFWSYQAVVQGGTLGASATLDAKLEQATDSSGSDAKDITDKAITQITDNDKQAVINLQHDDFDMDNNFTHFRLSVTVGTDASQVAAIVHGYDARYKPASDSQADSVAEIVA